MVREMHILATLVLIAVILFAAAFIIFPCLSKYEIVRVYGPSIRQRYCDILKAAAEAKQKKEDAIR